MNTYIVPVELKEINNLIVNAPTQSEAIKMVQVIIDKEKENLAENYNTVKILESEIQCEQDDEIIDAIKKDFNNIVIDSDGEVELITHEVNKDA